MKSPLTLYWSRRDFRLHDNEALSSAVAHAKESDSPFLPIFILEPYMTRGEGFGYSSQYMIKKAIPKFAEQFTQFVIAHHTAASYIISLSHIYSLTVFVNEDVYPDFYSQVEKIKKAGINIQVCTDRVTIPKDTKTSTGNLYSVFTPFKNAVWDTFIHTEPKRKVDTSSVKYISDTEINNFKARIQPADISKLCTDTRKIKIENHSHNIPEVPDLSTWYTTEEEALNIFKKYLSNGGVSEYKEKRDGLSTDGTSKMSVALAWGLVSARTLTHEIQKYYTARNKHLDSGALVYISELIWREFYGYLLYNNPKLLHTEFQKKFRGTIEWVPTPVAKERFEAWIKGETGYPIVDAAMKQLAKTGWMHNRARMIVASVLTKNFGVNWRWGQEYFRYMLIDLDEASNNGGWQWGASVGADPKPIRIFNAELQAHTHDSDGSYQNKWLTSDGFTEKPHITPIIEHKIARQEALRRYGLSHIKPRDY